MKKTELLEEAVSPDGTVLALYRHDGAYYIRANGIELMSTRRHHSERELAAVACAPLSGVRNPAVLVGGLGFGFTLRAALESLPAVATVVVAELLSAVVDWNLNADYALASDALRDPRVKLVHDDVLNVLRKSRGRFDAIILDVDNGAESFTTVGNSRLYGSTGIALAISALKPGGRLAYWSDREDPDFATAMRDAGLSVETRRSRAHATSGAWHHLLVGTLD